VHDSQKFDGLLNQANTIIRLKLLKIGALVRVSVRRTKVAMASACPAAQVCYTLSVASGSVNYSISNVPNCFIAGPIGAPVTACHSRTVRSSDQDRMCVSSVVSSAP
jgi:hypothetical protein